jgi:hypothetical protein
LFIVLFVAEQVHFSTFLHCKLLFESQAAQCSKDSDPFFLQAALAFIRFISSCCGSLCWSAIFTHQKWWNLLFWSINHSILNWLCCWARCWMLQDMDPMKTHCIFYVKNSMIDQIEHRKSMFWPSLYWE